KVAAAPFVLGPGRRVGELARHHDLDRHPGEFAGNARKFDDRPGELDTVQRITQAEFHRILRNAERAGRRLDAGALEGLHELLEAITLLAAEQVFRLHLEIIEAELIFLHTAIAEHLDLAAGHAFGWKIFRFRHMWL